MRSIQIQSTGRPEDVVTVVEGDAPTPRPGQAVLRMLFAPVNPADLNFIEGTYGKKPELPAVPGSEGVGEVVRLGDGVDGLTVGDRVILPAGAGSWRSHLAIRADKLIKVPGDADPRQLAMLRVNPATAFRMLHDFVPPEPGGWVIQNAANSGVGTAVIKVARHLGLRTVNVVRREELIEPLTRAGADLAILDGRDDFKAVRDRIGGEPVRLGLNAVGGDNALGVASCLAPGGIHVTYGAMGREPLKIPNSFLIFKDITFRGFWVTRWFERADRAEVDRMFTLLAGMVRDGVLSVPVAAEYPLDGIRDALRHAQTSARDGKILLTLG